MIDASGVGSNWFFLLELSSREIQDLTMHAYGGMMTEPALPEKGVPSVMITALRIPSLDLMEHQKYGTLADHMLFREQTVNLTPIISGASKITHSAVKYNSDSQ